MAKNVIQTINAPVFGHVAGGDVRVSNTTINNYHTHHHLHAHGPVHFHTHAAPPTFALQAPPAPPARATKRPKPAHDLSPAQKEVLDLMRPLPKHVRVSVLDFMRMEFGTGLVMELEPRELHKLRNRVLEVRREAGCS